MKNTALVRCPGCEEMFTRRNANHVYCTRLCRNRTWVAANRDKAHGYGAKWRKKNPEYSKQWRKAHPETAVAIDARWYAAHREQALAMSNGWKAANPDKVRAAAAKWRAENPERARQQGAQRRARKRAVPSEKYNFNEIFQRDKGRCQICRRPVNRKWKSPHRLSPVLDHIVPIARGGHDTKANVQLAHSICNARKRTDTLPQGEQLRLVG